MYGNDDGAARGRAGDGGSESAALERHHGPILAPRHHGVYHPRRRAHRHPHPHAHAAHARLHERPSPSDPLEAARPLHAPIHHHQHTLSARHRRATPRRAHLVETGEITAYDAASGTALVRLLGAPSRVIGPATVTACAPRDLTLNGASCLVVLLDEHNPRDGVVVAVWPAAGSASGVMLTRAGRVDIGVAGAAAGGGAAGAIAASVPFPTSYGGTPVVVATSTDAAWSASVSAITATGFTVTLQATAPSPAVTVTVEWIAVGP